MHEQAALNAYKKLITDNSGTLVTDFIHQGQPRYIAQVTTSTITPPNDYYFIVLYTTLNRDEKRLSGNTTRLGPSRAMHNIVIELTDYAVYLPGEEDELYEKMDGDFRTLADRVIALIRENYTVTDTGTDTNTGLSFRLDDNRLVTKEPLTEIFTQAEDYHAMLYCRISFTCYCDCTDDSLLY